MMTNPTADALMQKRLIDCVARVWMQEPTLSADAVVARITRTSQFKIPANVVRGAVIEWLKQNHPEGGVTEDGPEDEQEEKG